MKHHVLFDLLCFIVGYLISGLLMYLFTLLLKKLNWGITPLAKRFENSKLGVALVTIFIVILFIGLPFVLCITITWLEVVMDYYTDGDIATAIEGVLLNIFCCFYAVFVTKDMRRGRTW